MPIYIVRWPDLAASLVRAESEEELEFILDQIGNPEGCEWSVYEGPLFINFQLPVQWSIRDERRGHPVAPDQIVIDDVGPMAHGSIVETLELSLAEGDDGLETAGEILRIAFPALHAAVEQLQQRDDEGAVEGIVPEADLRAALHAEIARFVGVSWRRAHLERKTDKVSTLAREMDLPSSLVRRYLEEAQERRQADDKLDAPDDEE